MDFDDWIRIQLRSAASAVPEGASPVRSAPAFLSLLREPGLVIQGVVAGVALSFFAFGLMTVVPTPSLHLNFLPTQAQELPITSLALAPAPVPLAAVTVAELSSVPAQTTISAVTHDAKPAPKREGGTETASRSTEGTEPSRERADGPDGHEGDPSGSDHPGLPEGSGKEGD